MNCCWHKPTQNNLTIIDNIQTENNLFKHDLNLNAPPQSYNNHD